MNWHPTEEELILSYYGELPADEQDRVEAHLGACPACEAARRELSETFRLVDQAGVPEPGADFERVMWARISRELPSQPAVRFTRPLFIVSAIAAVLVAMVMGGYTWIQLQPAVIDDAAVVLDDAGSDDARERVLLTALNDHFSQTETLLVELLNAPAEPASFDFERTAADDLVASGRLYRQTARQTGDVRFVNVLEDLEGVLVEVARAPEQVNTRDFSFLRARIDDDGLLFKVRAVTTEVRDRQHSLMTQQ